MAEGYSNSATRKQNTDARLENLETMRQRARREIQSATENAINLVKERERELLEKLSDISDRQIKKCEENLRLREINAQVYKQKLAFIDHALQSNDEADLIEAYLITHASKEEESISEEEIEDNGAQDAIAQMNEITFDANLDALRESIDGMGHIEVTYRNSDQTEVTYRVPDTTEGTSTNSESTEATSENSDIKDFDPDALD